jgi:hypothetical protein
MKSHCPSGSIFGLGIQDQSVHGDRLSLSRRQAISPPIFLRTKNQASWLARNKEEEREETGKVDVPLSPAPSFHVFEDGASKALQNGSGLLTRGLNWLRARQLGRSSTRRLQVAATVSLGEKRFVAVIQVDGLQFLVGGGATNVALLAQLDGIGSFDHLLKETMAAPQGQMADSGAKQARGAE